MAVFERFHCDDVPVSVSINEAVELAKGFGGEDDSPRFVNGVLGRIARSMEGDGTREIGIRKSLGAKRKDIRRQFVIEAGTTSAIGGLLGIGLGCLVAMGVGSLIGSMLTAQMGGV